MMNDMTAIAALANDLADAAAEQTLALFRTDLATINKNTDGSFDPVTQADKRAEEVMRDLIQKVRPLDGILGEEFPSVESRSGLTWVLDPIDGTRAFISGLPVWGTLIALNDGKNLIFGMVDQPYIGERFVGFDGKAQLIRAGATRDLSVRACGGLGDAILFSTFPEIGTEAEASAFRKVSNACRLTRYGTDCYAYALLALGQIDLVIEAGLNAYDIQGPQGVIEAAGGIVTNWEGGPALHGGRILAAGDPVCHKAALDLLNSEIV